MPATPLESVGLTHVGDASIFEQWDGFHEINDTFELIKNDTDRVLLSISETAGCDINLDTTIQPKSTSTAKPLVVNSAAGVLLLDVNNTLVDCARPLYITNTQNADYTCRFKDNTGTARLSVDNFGSIIGHTTNGLTMKAQNVGSYITTFQGADGTNRVQMDNTGTIVGTQTKGMVFKAPNAGSYITTFQGSDGVDRIQIDNTGSLIALQTNGITAKASNGGSYAFSVQNYLGNNILQIDNNGNLINPQATSGVVLKCSSATAGNFCAGFQNNLGNTVLQVENSGCLTLPTTYGTAPTTTQLGYKRLLQNASVVSVTANTNTSVVATTAVPAGVYIIRATVNWACATTPSYVSGYISTSAASPPATDDLAAYIYMSHSTKLNGYFQVSRILSSPTAAIANLSFCVNFDQAATINTNACFLEYVRIA
jgi:hypothetical protein